MVQNDQWLIRVSRKDIMKMSYGKFKETDLTRFELDNVTLIQHNLIDSALKAGLSVIDDNHNLAAETVKNLYKIANKYKVEIEVINHNSHFENCIKLSAKTQPKMHDEAYIRDLVKRFTKKTYLRPEPKNNLNPVSSGQRYVPNPDLPKAIWLDADGTFFKMDPDIRGPFEFHKVHLDPVQEHIAELVRACQKDDFKIVVMSGRDESCREATYQAFIDAGVVPDDMFMRPLNTKDIPDYEIKHSLFWEHVVPKYDIRFALDDRQSVVNYTREVIGIPVLQVAPGDF
jgi:hypothetical protein